MRTSPVVALALTVGTILVGSCGTPLDPTGSAPDEPAVWHLDPREPAPDERTRELHLVVNDFQCASGTPPDDRLHPPEIRAGEDEVVITFSARALTDGQDCPGHGPAVRTVTLDEPLGDRRLFDGRAGERFPRDESPCEVTGRDVRCDDPLPRE